MRPRKLPAPSSAPPREVAVCLRLKALRERSGLSQERFAAEAGITKSALATYELCRTPLRFDLALRICRQFVFSEEWLATGSFAAVHRVAPQYELDTPTGVEGLYDIFQRQCVDLASEPVCQSIPRGTLFSAAYDQFLAPVYARLVERFIHAPRVVMTEFDNPELAFNLLRVFQERWFLMLGNEALRLKANAWSAQRSFLRALIEGGTATFKGYMGFPRPEIAQRNYDFLRALANDTKEAIGPLHGAKEAANQTV